MTDRPSGTPRLLKSALATSTLPLMVLGSAALATPAVADAPRQALTPRSASPVNIETAQLRLSTASLASSVPASFSGAGAVKSAKAAASYTVKAGDTLSHIAVRHDLSLSALLKANGLSASTIIHPGQKITLPGSAPSSSTSAQTASSGTTAQTYTVKAGDTLSHVAVRHDLALSSLLAANGLSASSIIYPGQKLTLSGGTTVAQASSGSSTASASTTAKTYTVVSGDTLYGISSRHGVSLSTLLKANGITSSSTIYPGQKLKLSGSSSTPAATPAGSPAGNAAATTYTVKSGDTLSGIAARNGMGLSVLLKANGLSSTATIHPGQKLKLSGNTTVAPASSGTPANSTVQSYTVKSGDTLYGIASRNGISLSTLLSANGFSESATIHPGQKLKLSGSGSSAAPAEDDLVPNTFLHYTYPDHIVRDANENKRALLNAGVPSRSQMQAIIADTARQMGVDPSLALAHAFTESSFNHASVSPANAIGAMQVIPSSGDWASDLVGRKLNLLDPHDNATAGVAIIRQLQRTAGSFDIGVAAYYQGLGGVQRNGMKSDTKDYVAKVKNYMKRF
ncbi:LysM peptidoglycan-binding domain-containing protein [Citricoccus muralis]|uniref:Soluble lytic murein transglycosylase-like protein n=1 Tax=Citricoccus muralis TaxID=169134 RepID=A0A3D9LBX5_9MICC|nr:LysM peptidoglycan-binding domain-containing protein [Citricoccus muralis]REE03370.1 soluble lytic murein transglycosylase-like protein [Citricoccus muralis]